MNISFLNPFYLWFLPFIISGVISTTGRNLDLSQKEDPSHTFGMTGNNMENNK